MDAQYSHQNYCLANTQKYNTRRDKKFAGSEMISWPTSEDWGKIWRLNNVALSKYINLIFVELSW